MSADGHLYGGLLPVTGWLPRHDVMARHDELLNEGPREAPAAQTAEERAAAPRRAIIGGSAVSIVILVGVHALGLIPGLGQTLAFIALLLMFGLSINRRVMRAARQETIGSPLRGLVLVLTAITATALVLAILSGFQPDDWIFVAVPAAATVVTWLADWLLMRHWSPRTTTA